MASFLELEELNSTHDSDTSYMNTRVSKSTPNVHQLQFTDKNDMLVQISRAVFDDFMEHIRPENEIDKILDGFADVCDSAVKSIKALTGEKSLTDPDCKLIFSQLSLEFNTYDLMLRLIKEGELVEDNISPVSYLGKLRKENAEFRRLWVLLKWNEQIAVENPSGFSAGLNDLRRFESCKNLYGATKMRGKFVHMDARHDGTAEAEDVQDTTALHKAWFSLLRSGLLPEAHALVQEVGLAGKSAFVCLRDFLYDEKWSPMDPFDDQYYMARSRAFCKQIARQLILVDDTMLSVDQCIWGMFSGSLSTLLTHASTTEDRLWSYITCAVDAYMDQETMTAHGQYMPEVMKAKQDLAVEEVEMTVKDIFNQITMNEDSIYYAVLGCIAMEDLNAAVCRIEKYVRERRNSEIPAHELRFLTHVILLYKLSRSADPDDDSVYDLVVGKYANLLMDMKLYTLVPSYLMHMSPTTSVARMVDFLEGIENVSDQQEILSCAADVGFDVGELCRQVYYRFKQKNPINADPNEAARSAVNMIRAWRWLSYGGASTMCAALIEANYLLRKLLFHNHLAEAVELMLVTPDDLPAQVEEILEDADKRNDKIRDSQDEFECYILYFEAMNHYHTWQKHAENVEAPKLPQRPSDEQWLRLDMRRRDEINVSINKARDCYDKYVKLNKSLTKKAINLLQGILYTKHGWLLAHEADEDSNVPEVRERYSEFVVIRDTYLYHIIKCLLNIYSKINDRQSVLQTAVLIVDPNYELDRALSRDHLRKLLADISRAGVILA